MPGGTGTDAVPSPTVCMFIEESSLGRDHWRQNLAPLLQRLAATLRWVLQSQPAASSTWGHLAVKVGAVSGGEGAVTRDADPLSSGPPGLPPALPGAAEGRGPSGVECSSKERDPAEHPGAAAGGGGGEGACEPGGTGGQRCTPVVLSLYLRRHCSIWGCSVGGHKCHRGMETVYACFFFSCGVLSCAFSSHSEPRPRARTRSCWRAPR